MSGEILEFTDITQFNLCNWYFISLLVGVKREETGDCCGPSVKVRGENNPSREYRLSFLTSTFLWKDVFLYTSCSQYKLMLIGRLAVRFNNQVHPIKVAKGNRIQINILFLIVDTKGHLSTLKTLENIQIAFERLTVVTFI